MAGRTMFITGVTGGVGRRLAGLARAGAWDVVGVYRRDHDRAAELHASWADGPGTLTLLAGDLSDPVEVDRLVNRLPDDYCPEALVHLAAPSLDLRPLHRIPWDEYQRQLDGAFKAVVLVTTPLVRRMLQNGGGRIVAALSSVVLGSPPRGFASYTAAKYALAGYMKCLAAEYAGRGIVANVVSPGPMDTDQLGGLPALLRDQIRGSIPGGRWVDPGSVARAIYWLASDAGPEVSGCNVALASAMTI